MKSATLRASSALRHIEHLSTLRLDPHIAIPEMLRTLHRVVPAAEWDFRWIDDRGRVLDSCRPDAAAAAQGATGDERAALRVNLGASGRPRAVLTVHQAAALAERGRRLFRAATPSLERALDGGQLVEEAFDEAPERTGALTVSAGGRLVSADRHVLLMVAEMDGRPLVGGEVATCRPGEHLPAVVADLCRRPSSPAPRPVERVTRWGAYRAQLFAQHAADDAPAGAVIVISKHLPRRVRLMRTLETLDLSPRERQVAFQLGLGADTGKGAAAMGVSVATWRSYVKRVYVRLDVRDRLELYARLNPADRRS